MNLEKMARLRDAVADVCDAIDRGEIQPTEQEMAALAQLVADVGGPLKHDLLVKLASRCANGRKALKDIAQ